MTQDAPYRLHSSLGYHLSIASRVQERRLDDQLKTLQLTRTTWCILLAVGNESLTQPSDIADFVGIDRTATSRALRGMEEDGLITRASGDGDRRTRCVMLTTKGEKTIQLATPMARSNARAIADQLAPEERAELLRLLGKLRTAEDISLNTL
ncbi:MAG TPA: transcriptional regulator [Rhodobacteraceae bacterium]|jgi:MarR family transcriptional regulator for hemolysin|nr:transcriptional regulator [Paracoccaceae bacterium]HBV53985.1 transcriptional regulator [Paracoccaceae bacterium]